MIKVKVLVADVEEQSVLAAKQARQAKTVSRKNSERAAVLAARLADSIHDKEMLDRADESSVETKTQVSIFMQQQSGSHHSVSPEYGLSAEMIPISSTAGQRVMRWFGIVLIKVKVLVADVEEQSVLAAKQARQAKTVSRKNSERAAVLAARLADSIHEIGNGWIELMSHLSKQKHRSVYSCSSRAGHTILFHLSMDSLQR